MEIIHQVLVKEKNQVNRCYLGYRFNQDLKEVLNVNVQIEKENNNNLAPNNRIIQ
jgi:hypothetical protein